MNQNIDPPRRRRGRPSGNGSDFTDTRTLLIRRAIEMLSSRGVSATAIDDVLKSVHVPKGSFYHYFASKDAFVTAALDAYASYFAHRLDRHFQNAELGPLARVTAFVDDACAGVERHKFNRGCLVGNLGQEVSCLDEKFRLRLEEVLMDWEQRLTQCLWAAVICGELSSSANCPALAHAFWVGWEGAILRARLVRSTAPMRAFFQLFVSALPRA